MTVTRGQHLIGKKFGNCILERLLGYGGSSAVYLGHEKESEREVAVKVFLPRPGVGKSMQRRFYRRFLREAEAASKLNHPNIVPVYSYGEQDSLPYIVMPYMKGGTLAEYSQEYGAISPQEVAWFLDQLASALDYAHAQGCIHCDIKPANILIDQDGHVRLSDFGIARIRRDEGAYQDTDVFSAEAMIGTPDYMSPEQALGQPLDGRSDIYSLGVTIYSLLVQRLPFHSQSPIALALLHVHESPPPLTSISSHISSEIDQVILKALSKDPQERYQNGHEFAHAFREAVQTSEAMLVRDLSLPEKFTEKIQTVVTKVRTQRLARWQLFSLCLLVPLLFTSIWLLLQYQSSLNVGAQLPPSPTVIATPSPTQQDLLLDRVNWPESRTFFFEEQSYHVVNTSTDTPVVAPYYHHTYADFTLSIDVKRVQSTEEDADFYGVIFRAAEDLSSYYLFAIAPEQGGRYVFVRYDGDWTVIKNGKATSFFQSSDHANTLTVQAYGNEFRFLLNDHVLEESVQDAHKNPLTQGLVGFYVEDEGVEVAFTHLLLWSEVPE